MLQKDLKWGLISSQYIFTWKTKANYAFPSVSLLPENTNQWWYDGKASSMHSQPKTLKTYAHYKRMLQRNTVSLSHPLITVSFTLSGSWQVWPAFPLTNFCLSLNLKTTILSWYEDQLTRSSVLGKLLSLLPSPPTSLPTCGCLRWGLAHAAAHLQKANLTQL